MSLEGLPNLAGLEKILAPYLGRRAFVIDLTDDRGRALGNNGDQLMTLVFRSILRQLEVHTVQSLSDADYAIVPPNGALLENYRAPWLLADRLASLRVPLVIFPSSANFPTVDPSFMFRGRTTRTDWILREPYSFAHLNDDWLAGLNDAGVHLHLDHDVVVSGHQLTRQMLGDVSRAADAGFVGESIVAARLDVEASSPPVRSDTSPPTPSLLSTAAQMVPTGVLRPVKRIVRNEARLQANRALVNRLPPSNVQWAIAGRDSVDLSDPTLVSFQRYLSALTRANCVATNRLHVALPAALTGKQTYLVDSGYHKLRGVYEQSLRSLDNLVLVT